MGSIPSSGTTSQLVFFLPPYTAALAGAHKMQFHRQDAEPASAPGDNAHAVKVPIVTGVPTEEEEA